MLPYFLLGIALLAVLILTGSWFARADPRSLAKGAERKNVNAVVFVGDSMEEDVDHLGALAGELGLLGVPAFMFHEGGNPVAGFAFQQIARLTNGAYCRFDSSSAHVLRDLLSAVAVYAAGGRPALENLARRRGGEVLKIAHQVQNPSK